MSDKPRLRLGEALIQRGLLTESQLEIALSEQKQVDQPLGKILVDLGFVSSVHLAEMIAADLQLPLVRAKDIHPDPVLVSALDVEFVRDMRAFPIRVQAGSLRVAMCDPSNPTYLSALRQRFAMSLEVAVLPDEDLVTLIRKYFGGEGKRASGLLGGSRERRALEDQPIEALTKTLIMQGIHQGATDIHLQPETNVTRVRYRLDGVCQQGDVLPREVTNAVISRIKILADLDIAERRRPQDGRIHFDVDGRRVHLRVSVMPVANGEAVVLRVLDRASGNQRLANLGISEERCRTLGEIANYPHGLFLVTGPTGSGKTTTLYAMLREVDAIQRNVTTIEDPVEYDLPFIRQSQVDTSAGFDFGSGLRALLRQDPDVILIGEIRDEETAEMAIKASLTGHLVFATLHTNSALGAIPRLTDLGISPYLIADTLIGVLGQRLVRKICQECSERVLPSSEESMWLEQSGGNIQRGRGCSNCSNTGYSGRVAITELFLPDDKLADVLRRGGDPTELRVCAFEAGFETFGADGRRKVLEGQTTVAEVQRVVRTMKIGESIRHAG